MKISDELLELVRCPVSLAPLKVSAEELIAMDSGRRYPVVGSVPVLVNREPGEAAPIVNAFRRRSVSYYTDNYESGGNAERRARQNRITEILRTVVRPGARVLDAGAGPGSLAETAQALGARYIALDISLDNLLAGRARVGKLDAIVGDVRRLPFENDVFDVVLSVGCLEYVEDLQGALRELVRVTAPGGVLLATFANARSPRRWWEQIVLSHAIRIKRRIQDRLGEYYGRRLDRPARVRAALEELGGAIELVEYGTTGIIGYPLSRIAAARTAEKALAQRVPHLRRVGGEFVVIARKRKV